MKKGAINSQAMQKLSGMVNIHGQPILPMGPSFRAVKPPPSRAKPQTLGAEQQGPTERHGFRVLGFAPASLAEAERAHLAEDEARIALHKKERRPGLALPEPFDPEGWMNSARPDRVNPKPYAVRSSAEQCADMARKAGWLRVNVVEVTK